MGLDIHLLKTFSEGIAVTKFGVLPVGIVFNCHMDVLIIQTQVSLSPYDRPKTAAPRRDGPVVVEAYRPALT